MKLLHTSDWHIGRTLYGRKRYEEFESFLTWLAGYRREGKEADEIPVSDSKMLYATTLQVWLGNVVITDEARNKFIRIVRKQRQIYTCFQIIGHEVKGL
jgi:hypothetical protein